MIVVSGVSGALGKLILDGLRADPEVKVVGASRSGDGATVRRLDFDAPGTLAEGLSGADVLVLVSAGYAEDDVVLARHGAVADAAAAAGVRHVIYTSLAGSGELLSIALAHRWTEKRLTRGPFDVTILRNGLYAEISAGLAATAVKAAAETGVFTAPFGQGRMSVVARQDLADVSVRVAAETAKDLSAGHRSRHAGRTYELEGVTAIGGQDLAAVLSAILGRPVRYEDQSLSQARLDLADAGLEPYQIGHTLSIYANLRADMLQVTTTDLTQLLTSAPRPVLELIAEAARKSV